MDNKSFYLVYGVPGSRKTMYVEHELKPFIKDLQHFDNFGVKEVTYRVILTHIKNKLSNL